MPGTMVGLAKDTHSPATWHNDGDSVSESSLCAQGTHSSRTAAARRAQVSPEPCTMFSGEHPTCRPVAAFEPMAAGDADSSTYTQAPNIGTMRQDKEQ